MPPTSEVPANSQFRTQRKVLIRYLDHDGHPREKQMPFAEFQAFCIAWYAYENRSTDTEDRKSILANSRFLA